MGMFLQPYKGWWVSCTMKTMTICFDEMLLCLLQMTMGMLPQPYEGWWVSRSLAREQVHKHMGDTGMMDYMLKAIANRTVGPWAVFRCHCLSCLSCSATSCSLFLLFPLRLVTLSFHLPSNTALLAASAKWHFCNFSCCCLSANACQ